MTNSRPLVISWIGFHGRSAALAKALDGEAVFIKSTGNVLRRYVRQYTGTVDVVRRNPLSPVVVMLPPLPALIGALRWRNRGAAPQVWADLHTGVFENPRWAWARGLTLRIIRTRCAGAIVTNESLAAKGRDAGLKQVLVLDDILEPREYIGGSGQVVFPVTYANDEPIKQILRAAALTPEIEYVLTGKAPDWVREMAPTNVTLPGFVSRADFELLMKRASAIGALTDRPFTMQRAGYEALELGAPLLTSPTDDLRAYFGDAVEYSDASNSADSIARAVQMLVKKSAEYESAMVSLREAKLEEQTARLKSLADRLSARDGVRA